MRINETNFETMQSSSSTDVVTFYDQYAENWDERFGSTLATSIFLQQRLSSFLRVVSNLSGLDNALELGVGTGVYLDAVSKKFKQLDVVDGSPKMIEVLQAKVQNSKINNVTPHIGMVEDMPFIKSSSKDIVYFFGLIEHIINMDHFLMEISRVLKPSGVVVGVTPNSASPWYQIRRFVRGTGKHCSSDHYYGKKEISMILESHGFVPEKFDYFGSVPAGLKGKFLPSILKPLDRAFSSTPMLSMLGGITFLGRKK